MGRGMGRALAQARGAAGDAGGAGRGADGLGRGLGHDGRLRLRVLRARVGRGVLWEAMVAASGLFWALLGTGAQCYGAQQGAND